MAKNKLPAADVTEDPHYHDTWMLLRKYRDVVWSLEVSVRQVRNRFRIDYGKTIEDFLESVYLAGADLSGTELEHQAKCIEQSHKMLCLVDSAVDLMRAKHKNGEEFYWLLYYAYLSPQELQNVEEIIDQLRPHIRDISTRTYYRKRKEAVEVLSSVLWGYTAQDSAGIVREFCSKLNICGRDTLTNVVPVNHSTPFGVFHLLTYETMIDNLLTMSEIIQMVTDVRTKDAGIIQKMAEIMTAYAEYEKNLLSLYRDAAKVAVGIFDRWADEFDDLDEDYEPDEFFSD